MASRINSIITVADHKCTALLDTMPDGSKAKSNVEGINGVCRALLRRRTPLAAHREARVRRGAQAQPTLPTRANDLQFLQRSSQDLEEGVS